MAGSHNIDPKNAGWSPNGERNTSIHTEAGSNPAQMERETPVSTGEKTNCTCRSYEPGIQNWADGWEQGYLKHCFLHSTCSIIVHLNQIKIKQTLIRVRLDARWQTQLQQIFWSNRFLIWCTDEYPKRGRKSRRGLIKNRKLGDSDQRAFSKHFYLQQPKCLCPCISQQTNLRCSWKL